MSAFNIIYSFASSLSSDEEQCTITYRTARDLFKLVVELNSMHQDLLRENVILRGKLNDATQDPRVTPTEECMAWLSLAVHLGILSAERARAMSGLSLEQWRQRSLSRGACLMFINDL